MDRSEHWESIYRSRQPTDVSWFEAEPQVSLALIESLSPSHKRIIDIGGGASRLVDHLVTQPFDKVAVLDISPTALELARIRLGKAADNVTWITGDITQIDGMGEFDIWHDRAVFHFLAEPNDRQRYASLASRTIPVGGHLILGTFALDGPEKCSGLQVRRYDAVGMGRELGPEFRLIRETSHTHMTPAGKAQEFAFGVFERQPTMP